MLKLVMTGEALKEETIQIVQKDGTVTEEKIRVTPQEVLRKMLDDPLYNPVRKILGKSTEGALREYEFLSDNSSSNGDDENHKDEQLVEVAVMDDSMIKQDEDDDGFEVL